ncbi:HAD family hydrolase [Oleidesulfovibrio alaskensis]|uniref:HAD family hydrolase n=1 Tax=Oleidesulfovibrio alaskensis TaxID=58180 RepID=UPI0003FA62CA|nr:HAD family hydrolase [Oleidesulfovibrio alaskensis]
MHKRALLFDWGGTLMESMPWYLGREKGWSGVPATPHAREVVMSLAPCWTTGLASNAAESEEHEVRASLDTMGLGQVLDRIYTYRFIGRPKPQAGFWSHVLRDLKLDAGCVVMVGDDYMADIWGANQLGIRGVWFNRRTEERREAELVRTMHDFRELPALLADMGFDSPECV